MERLITRRDRGKVMPLWTDAKEREILLAKKARMVGSTWVPTLPTTVFWLRRYEQTPTTAGKTDFASNDMTTLSLLQKEK